MSLHFLVESLSKYTPSGIIDPRSSVYKDLAFAVPCVGTIIVDATYEANLPLVAAHKLGNPDLWWALLMYNGLVDPIGGVHIGSRLRIPDKASLLAVLNLNVDEVTDSNTSVTI